MGRDLFEPIEPTYEKVLIRWGDRQGDPNIIFEVHSSPFISRFPVENDRTNDREHLSHVARDHWGVLEEIARAAVAANEIEQEIKHRGVNFRTWRIASDAFSRLAEERGFRPSEERPPLLPFGNREE